MSLHFRWEGKVPTLHAIMRKRERDLWDSTRAPWDRDPWDMISVNLAERITIKDGAFEVQSVPADLPFNADAVEISLKDETILRAVLKDDEGNKRSSTLDLDEHLGNEEGKPQSTHLPILRHYQLMGLFPSFQGISNGAARDSPNPPKILDFIFMMVCLTWLLI